MGARCPSTTGADCGIGEARSPGASERARRTRDTRTSSAHGSAPSAPAARRRSRSMRSSRCRVGRCTRRRNGARTMAATVRQSVAPTMRLRWKRALDLALTVPALIVLSPVFALVALAVRASLGSPVIFKQQRPGIHERPFTLYKFRTMRDARDAQGALLPDSRRLTRLCAFLRATSLDELPELVNVLRGDMSLVGPRPLLMEYLPLYSRAETAS